MIGKLGQVFQEGIDCRQVKKHCGLMGCLLQGFGMTSDDSKPAKRFNLSYHKYQSIGSYPYRQED
ncbi:MAG: hypothetical protein MUO26_02270 [Methanotrichaceae archaeon]|nr:hypothetical protein [Methanotrichaceae archaeon]